MKVRSDDASPEGFEVTAFGAVGHDRMVSTGSGAVQHLQLLGMSMGGADDEFFEAFRADEAGARAGDKQPAGFHHL